jgi:hypothetical protein
MPIDPKLQNQVKEAWAKLPPEHRRALEPLIWSAHTQALAARAVPAARLPARAPHELSTVHTMLNEPAPAAEQTALPDLVVHVGSDGTIWGTGQYENLDPRWAYTLVAYADTLASKVPFPTAPPPVIGIPDDVTIALLGDWGAGQYGDGPSPAVQVADVVRNQVKPGIAVHLGDVYYAGTEQSLVLEPYEQNNFLSLWPAAPGGSFALNSNHDMYGGGTGYFQQTLSASGPFAAQQGMSVFALENANWIIVGLDSAYFATSFFNDGAIDPTQQAFIREMALKAQASDKGLILLSHHNGLSNDGSAPVEPLWSQVTSQIPAGTSVYWYWGHIHIGAVYAPFTDPATQVTVYGRCIGHSAIPWGFATELESRSVLWFESSLMKGAAASNYPIVNGFEAISLSGSSISEVIYDQYGNRRWSAEGTTGRPPRDPSRK